MKTLIHPGALTALLTVLGLSALAQGTAFTYQGRLNDGNSPANGAYDLAFALFDAASGGTQQGGTLTNAATAVSNGLFTVTLDFGNEFSGADRWLEIGVRTNGGGEFALLSPRQALTPTPYSMHAASATSALSANTATSADSVAAANIIGTVDVGQISANVALRAGGNAFTGNQTIDGNVGIGTPTPGSKLSVAGIVESLSGGVKFPDGSIQTKAAVATRIIASVDMQFSQDDRAGWIHVEALGDDTVFPNIPLGFTYTGFGVNTANISLSSNGILFFGQNASSEWVNNSLPSGISQDAMLFFFWDDLLDEGTGEYFEYATLGSPGGRVFNLYFRNKVRLTCGTDAINVMISIHEGSNLIKVSYSGMSGCASMRGSTGTIGFQTPGGANATAFTVGVNSPVLDDNANRQTMSFHPPN